MSVMTRPKSPFLWLWIPGAAAGVNPFNTKIPIGDTKEQRKANLQTVKDILAARVLELRKRANGVPEPELPPDAYPFSALAARYAEEEIPTHRGAYREIPLLPRFVAAFGHADINDPPTAWFDRVTLWRKGRLATGTVVEHYGGKHGTRHTFPPPSPRTVNREIGFLQQIFAWAVRAKVITASPLNGLEDLKVAPIQRRLTPPDEEARLLATLAPDDKAIYLIARDGLVRLGDAIDAKRGHDHGTTFLFPFTKNGDDVTIPITARLRAALDAVPVDPLHPEYYFPRRRQAAKAEDRTRGYTKAIKRACRDATPPIPYGKKLGGLTFHWSTRTTGATRMIRTGGDGVIADVAKIGGWRDVGVLLEIYQQTVTDDMQRIAELASGASVTPAPTPKAKTKLRRVK
jgi:integrase